MTTADPRNPAPKSPAPKTPVRKYPGDQVAPVVGPLPRTAVPYGITDPVSSARAELKAALAAIEVKGNFPRRIEKATAAAVVKARVFARRNPVATVAAVVGVAAAVGGIVWAIARVVSDERR